MPRKPYKNRLKEYAIVGGLSVFSIWLLFSIVGIIRKEEVARHKVGDTRQELAVLKEREATLQKNIQELETPRGKEAALRQTHGVARPGEEVIVVVPSKDVPPPPEPTTFKKFLNWFGF
jgi:cell division protein FtsB